MKRLSSNFHYAFVLTQKQTTCLPLSGLFGRQEVKTIIKYLKNIINIFAMRTNRHANEHTPFPLLIEGVQSL